MAEKVDPKEGPPNDPLPLPPKERTTTRSTQPSHRNGVQPRPNRPRSPPGQPRPRGYIIQVKGPPEKPCRDERRRSFCRRCCCCLCATLAFLVLAAAVAIGILYLVFRPKSLSYSVDSLSIGGLNLSSPTFNSGFLSPEVRAAVRAVNPNKRIGFYYREGSSVGVYYHDRHLSWGEWPAFYHGTNNETVVHMTLRGKEVRLTASEEHWMRKEERNRTVPLKFFAEVPVRIEFGKLKLWKMTVKLGCDVVVNKVLPEAKVVSRDCGYKVNLM